MTDSVEKLESRLAAAANTQEKIDALLDLGWNLFNATADRKSGF